MTILPDWRRREEGLGYMRILLAGMSNMLSSIVAAAIAQAPDVIVVGQVDENEDFAPKIGLASADAVIVQTGQPGSAESFVPLFRTFPTLKVIAIDASCSSGFLYQLLPHSIRLPELSADLLLSTLRANVRDVGLGLGRGASTDAS